MYDVNICFSISFLNLHSFLFSPENHIICINIEENNREKQYWKENNVNEKYNNREEGDKKNTFVYIVSLLHKFLTLCRET